MVLSPLIRLLLVALLIVSVVGAGVATWRSYFAALAFDRWLARQPVRSTKADAKRAAHAYAESVVGHPLTWKKARKLLAAWEREGWENRWAGGDATAAEENE